MDPGRDNAVAEDDPRVPNDHRLRSREPEQTCLGHPCVSTGREIINPFIFFYFLFVAEKLGFHGALFFPDHFDQHKSAARD